MFTSLLHHAQKSSSLLQEQSNRGYASDIPMTRPIFTYIIVTSSSLYGIHKINFSTKKYRAYMAYNLSLGVTEVRSYPAYVGMFIYDSILELHGTIDKHLCNKVGALLVLFKQYCPSLKNVDTIVHLVIIRNSLGVLLNIVLIYMLLF